MLILTAIYLNLNSLILPYFTIFVLLSKINKKLVGDSVNEFDTLFIVFDSICLAGIYIYGGFCFFIGSTRPF